MRAECRSWCSSVSISKEFIEKEGPSDMSICFRLSVSAFYGRLEEQKHTIDGVLNFISIFEAFGIFAWLLEEQAWRHVHHTVE